MRAALLEELLHVVGVLLRRVELGLHELSEVGRKLPFGRLSLGGQFAGGRLFIGDLT